MGSETGLDRALSTGSRSSGERARVGPAEESCRQGSRVHETLMAPRGTAQASFKMMVKSAASAGLRAALGHELNPSFPLSENVPH